MKMITRLASIALLAPALLGPAIAEAQAPAAAPKAPAVAATPAAAVAAPALPVIPPKPKELKVGDKAPSIEMPMLGATTFKLADHLAGKKAAVFVVVQTACSSCRYELEYMKSKADAKNYEVFLFNVDANGGTPKWEENIKGYLEALKLNYRVLIDPKMDVARTLGISSTPAIIAISSNGVIKMLETGFNADMAKTIETVLAEIN